VEKYTKAKGCLVTSQQPSHDMDPMACLDSVFRRALSSNGMASHGIEEKYSWR
jgi:hypothetical protein